MRNFEELPITLTEQLGILQYLRDLVNAQGIRDDVRPLIVQSIINVFVQQPAVGASDAVSLVEGMMEYFYAGDGSSVGIGLAEAIAQYTFIADGLSANTSSAIAQVEYTAHMVGESVGGTNYVAGIIEAGFEAVGFSETIYDVSGISEQSATAIAASAGTGSAVAVGETGILGAGSNVTLSSAIAVSQFASLGAGASSGAATVAGVGSAVLDAAGASSGAATDVGAGGSILIGAGASGGVATVAAVGGVVGAFYRSHYELTPSQSRSNSTFTKPSGTESGDTLVMTIFTYSAPAAGVLPTITAPSGFSNLGTQPAIEFADAADTRGGIYVFYKVAGGSEPSSYATTHTTNMTEGILYAVGGGYGGKPDIVATSGTGTSISAGPITIKNTNAFVINVDAVWDDATADLPPTGYTQRYDPVTPVNGIYAADKKYTTNGSTGAITATFSGNQVFSPWGAVIIDVEGGEYARAGVATGTATVLGEGVAV